MTLSFSRIVCRQCGDKRIVGVVCPTCGEEPDEREVDPDRQRRVRLARTALEILDGPAPDASPELSPLAAVIWGRMLVVFDDLLGAVMAANGDAREEPTLMNAIIVFRQLEGDVAATPRLRPWIDLWTAVEDVLSRLRTIVRHYLLGAAADTPLEAQREAQAAQRELDEAADPAAALSKRMEDWARVDAAETIDKAVAVLAEIAFERSGARNLLEFDHAGYTVYERVSGMKTSLQGLGVGLNFIAEQARGPFDESRVWRVAQESFSLLTADSNWLATTVNDSVWRNDHKAALEKLWDAGHLHTAALAAVRHDRQTIRAMLGVGRDFVESTGKRYLATVIAASKKTPYAKYRDQSAGNLLIAAEQMGLASLVAGLDRTVRIASAHDEFALEGGEVILMDRGVEVERLSIGVLVDRVLTGVETTLALGLGVLCAAIHGGIEPDQVLPDLDALGVEPEEALAWVLASSGWRDVQVRMEGGVVTASGTADEGLLTMSHVAALIPRIPDGCKGVTVLAETRAGQQELQGPFEPFRVFQAATDELEKQVRHVELLRSWVRDGTPLVSETQARKIVSVLSLQSLTPDDVRGTIRRLRMLLQAARTIEDEELADVLAALIGGLRGSYLDLESDGYSAALSRIGSWAGMRVEPLDASLIGLA